MNGKPVMITTEWRGMFFGYIEDDTKAPTEITLTNARNCLYWSAQSKGILGLAEKGPDGNCRIGPKVPKARLWKITSIIDCTPQAAEAWEQGPWGPWTK